ncbi:hypothetical protein KR093_007009 [Drosophila rubida]|uniref:Uncharacterized protein n=1 Tax=Drosophila rubida TaxID=30044 RepID=A0AAD4K697_9MUSC|nr:hypothetical protein KR093_007009 [Drosophila rubida]
MYTASEVYGKDLEMRHNSQAKSLTNNDGISNNNSSIVHEQQIPFCNVDNAANYYKSVNLIGPAWNLKGASRSTNPSPSKCSSMVGRQLCRAAGYPAPASELLQYSDSFAKSFAPRKVSGGNNNQHTYQLMTQQVDYYSGSQPKGRQQVHSNSAPVKPERKYTPALSLEKDPLKRQIRARSTAEFLDGPSIYPHDLRPNSLANSWSSVM